MIEEKISLRRVIGEYGGKLPGPNLVLLGGVHGNEPAAILALNHVLETLRRQQPPAFRGKLIALRGNLPAISAATRYIDEDLNRIWIPELMKPLEASPEYGTDRTVEQAERRELFRILSPLLEDYHNPLYLVDLHTTSAESPPFVIIADTIRNRRFARDFPVPIILGLEEQLEGTILHYLGDLGFRAVAFEAGQHHNPASVNNHIAAIWIALAGAGCLQPAELPGYEQQLHILRRAAEGLPPVFETRFRYAIAEGEHFRMKPGYRNFQPISRGEVLASNHQGEIRNTSPGNIFMPLYQTKGDDGYFRIRKVAYFWLIVSEWLRRFHLERMLPFLPGIRLNPEIPNELIVNRRVARWLVLEIFHLLGYRKKRIENGKLIVTKRRYDLHGPEADAGRD